jgi:hypothetical protein
MPQLLRQHARRASFLWAQRQELVATEDVMFSELEGLDRSLAANVDGLALAKEDGAAVEALLLPDREPGDRFVEVTLRSDTVIDVEWVADLHVHDEQSTAVRDALIWNETPTRDAALRQLVCTAPSPVCALAMQALSRLGVASGTEIDAAVRQHAPDVAVVQAALEHARSTLSRDTALASIFDAGTAAGLHVDVSITRAWQSPSSSTLRAALAAAVTSAPPLRDEWLAWIVHCAGDEIGTLLAPLERDDRFAEAYLAAVHAGGLVRAVPWLLDRLDDPRLGQHALRVLRDIVGLGDNGAQVEQPLVRLTGDHDDGAVDVDACRRWWEAHCGEYTALQYRRGRPWSPAESARPHHDETIAARRLTAIAARARSTLPLCDVTGPAWRVSRQRHE